MATFQGYPVVDESYSDHPSNGRGYEGRDLTAYPLAGLKCASMYAEPLLTDAEIKEIIAYKDANAGWITDHCDRVGLTVKNQQNSSYCWIHAPVHAMEIAYVMANDPMHVLSAFMPGAIIKNGRNQGGSGIQGVEFLAENGTCLEPMHPSMDFSTSNSAEAKANALLHKIVGYEEMESGNHQAIRTAICRNQGVTVGIPAWSHEITLVRLIWDGNKFIYVIDNSWGTSWGKNGRGTLSASYSRFDEAGVVRTVTPSLN